MARKISKVITTTEVKFGTLDLTGETPAIANVSISILNGAVSKQKASETVGKDFIILSVTEVANTYEMSLDTFLTHATKVVPAGETPPTV